MKNKINVVKRNGSQELFDISKIKKSIANAVEGTGANPLELESKIDEFIKQGVKSSDIQANIIRHAVQLATPVNPEWLNVAGRALAADLWASFTLKGMSFKEVIKHNISIGEYTKDLGDYSDAELDYLSKVINHDIDLTHSHSSLITVAKKYLSKNETNQFMHMANAMRLAHIEPEHNRVNVVEEFYNILSQRKLSLATPLMASLRNGGNLASCFIIAIEDSLDSIYDNLKRMAVISKAGGGVGCYLGYIRGKGSSVGGVANAAGPITQWMKLINDTATAVNQGGRRAGAITVAIPVYHSDIFEFLDSQSESGDLRLKSYDLFLQVCMPDLFLERDKANLGWTAFCPKECLDVLNIDVRGLYGKEFEQAYKVIEKAFDDGKLKVASRFKARELMKEIMKVQFQRGTPYIAFTDRMNERNPNKNYEGSLGIPCVNICVESYSNIVPDKLGHVCQLSSINLANIDSLEELGYISKVATKILNYANFLTKSPDPINLKHGETFKTIGIGMLGLNDYLAKNRMSYKNLAEIREISELIELNAAEESVNMAKRFGSFDAFPNSTWASGEQIAVFKSKSVKYKKRWDDLQEGINKHGMHNSQLTSPAPNTSTSIYQEASASFLPVYSAFFTESNKNGDLRVSAKYLKQHPMGYAKTLSKFSAKEIIDVAAALQDYVDTGLSTELLFDQSKEGFTAKDLYDAIHYAHASGLKTLYYIRSLKKTTGVDDEEACLACAG